VLASYGIYDLENLSHQSNSENKKYMNVNLGVSLPVYTVSARDSNKYKLRMEKTGL
jgi:hypothetical protein